MAINFPTGPTVGQVYTFGSRSWKWNGNGWESITAAYGPQGTQGIQGPQGDPAVAYSSKTANYILASSDDGDLIAMNIGSANTVTVNTGVFTVGQQVTIAQIGTGKTQILAGTNVTIWSTPGAYLRTQYSAASLICLNSGSPQTFLLTGDTSAT